MGKIVVCGSGSGYLLSPDLSLKAKGLMGVLLSLPEGFDCTAETLAQVCRESRNTLLAIASELKKSGYLEIVRSTENGRKVYKGSVWVAYPQSKNWTVEQNQEKGLKSCEFGASESKNGVHSPKNHSTENWTVEQNRKKPSKNGEFATFEPSENTGRKSQNTCEYQSVSESTGSIETKVYSKDYKYSFTDKDKDYEHINDHINDHIKEHKPSATGVKDFSEGERLTTDEIDEIVSELRIDKNNLFESAYLRQVQDKQQMAYHPYTRLLIKKGIVREDDKKIEKLNEFFFDTLMSTNYSDFVRVFRYTLKSVEKKNLFDPCTYFAAAMAKNLEKQGASKKKKAEEPPRDKAEYDNFDIDSIVGGVI